MSAPAGEIPRNINGDEPFWKGMMEHAGQVGQIVWGWNFLQSQIFHVFLQLTFPQNRDLALVIWHSHASDKNQRELTFKIAESLKPDASHLLGDIKWVNNQADRIGQIRNASVHTGISLGASDVWVDGIVQMQVFPDRNSGKPTNVERLTAKPIAEQWAAIRDDLWVLGRYAGSLAGQICGTNTSGGPFIRPRLLSLE